MLDIYSRFVSNCNSRQIAFVCKNSNKSKLKLNVDLLIIMLNSNEENSDLSESTDVLELPKYCFYNKFLLVEELALEKNFSRLHQGRCTLIGKLSQHRDGYFLLENIKLSYLPRKFNLWAGAVSLRLFKFATWDVQLKIGLFCEVIGEVVLWNPNNSRDNWLRLTPRGALEFSKDCSKCEREEKVENLQKQYLPAINIFGIDYIECPADLIQRHLKIRILSRNLHQRNSVATTSNQTEKS